MMFHVCIGDVLLYLVVMWLLLWLLRYRIGGLLILLNSYKGWLSWFGSLTLQFSYKRYLEGVFFTTWWFIWLLKNSIVFDFGGFKKRDLCD